MASVVKPAPAAQKVTPVVAKPAPAPAPAPVTVKPAPAPAPAPVSTKPEVTGETEEKKGRPNHPLVGNADLSVYPFEVVPADYDPAKYAQLRRDDFKSEATYFEYKANMHEEIAKRFRAKAEEVRLIGDTTDKGKAKRLLKMTQKMAELQKELESTGVDVAKLLAAVQAQMETKAPAATA